MNHQTKATVIVLCNLGLLALGIISPLLPGASLGAFIVAPLAVAFSLFGIWLVGLIVVNIIRGLQGLK